LKFVRKDRNLKVGFELRGVSLKGGDLSTQQLGKKVILFIIGN
jgi:hypothetical protein